MYRLITKKLEMLKKGHVYKAIYGISRIHYAKGRLRNYMIFAPSEDIHNTNLKDKSLTPIFHINLAGEFNQNGYMGTWNLVRVERPSSEQDFKEIKEITQRYGMRYNKKLNMIESIAYDTRER
jgi:hypothetical protein